MSFQFLEIEKNQSFANFKAQRGATIEFIISFQKHGFQIDP